MLSVADLQVAYGRIRAVQGIGFSVAAGEILTLVGANGAGKSSTLRAICGLTPPSAGTVMFEGQRIDGRPFHRIGGIALSPEGRVLAPSLTVEETLRLGAGPKGARTFARQKAEVLARLPMLEPLQRRRAGTLSGGQAQMLALGRALISRPRLLLLDEPSLGLSPAAAREVFTLVAALRGDGLAVLLVEQNVLQALAIADRAAVIEGGRLVAEGRAADLRDDPRLADIILSTGKMEVPK
jgi:branched-chain amino acid transport system ATP-binding protein